MKKRLDPETLRRLDALYRELPRVACTGRCAQACGAIALTIVEADRLRMATHRKPSFSADVTCVYLHDGRCSAYALRPLVCRLYGVTRNLSCPFGCMPERWLTPQEQLAIFERLAEIVGSPIMHATTDTGELIPIATAIDALAARANASALSKEQEADIARRDEMVRTLRALHGGRIVAVGRGPEPYVNVDEEQ